MMSGKGNCGIKTLLGTPGEGQVDMLASDIHVEHRTQRRKGRGYRDVSSSAHTFLPLQGSLHWVPCLSHRVVPSMG